MRLGAAFNCAAARSLLAAGILITSPASAAAPTQLSSNPAAACASAGGTYLGDMKCQMPNGSVAPIMGSVQPIVPGTDVVIGPTPSIPVASGTPHAWALATTAILFQFNGKQQDLLGGEIATFEARVGGLKILSQSWNVRDRNTLLSTLTWLQFAGHRQVFEELGNQVDLISDAQFKEVETAAATRAALTGTGIGVISLELARRYHRSLAGKSILGWDLIRYIMLCRWGYLVGFLSEDEAWGRIMPAALRLQKTFSSWEELQSNYLIGRMFWSVQQSETSGDRFKSVYDQLLADKTSPWNVNAWNMNLETASAMPIAASKNP